MKKQTKTHFVNNPGNSPYIFFESYILTPEIKEENKDSHHNSL